jgi:type I restriction enzyme S subunit
MVEDVTRDGKTVFPSVDSLTLEGAKRSRPCSAGTLTLVCSGVVGVPSFLGIDACIHDGFIGLVDIKAEFSKDFIYHQLKRLQSEFDAAATHGGVFTNLTTKGVAAFQFAAPADLAEQQAIAEALSDADGVVEGLERLIVKKRRVKQGAMQNLLTAKRRLTGFSGEWVERSLFDFCRFISGKAHEPYIDPLGEFVCVNSKFISTEGSVAKMCNRNITPARKDDILLVMSDLPNGRALAKAFLTPKDNYFAVNQRVCILRPKQSSAAKFFFYLLNRNPYFLSFDDGVNQTHLLNSTFEKFRVSLPAEIEEQVGIGEILHSMDTEISALETRLQKARAIKEGMMQNLLTGRIRLV